jgi:hypothetical protein
MAPADPGTTTPSRRKYRDIHEITKLSGVTWFGHCVTHIVTAMRELPPAGKLMLLEDLVAFCTRQHAEIQRHQRDRPRGWR